jgi:hypothetical protein
VHTQEFHIFKSGDLPKNLDLLALLGGLFREAYLVCELEISSVLKRLFLAELEKYCAQDWLKDAGDYLNELAERRVLHWQMAEHFEGAGLYPDWPPGVIPRPLLKINDATLKLISMENEIYNELFPPVVDRPKDS